MGQYIVIFSVNLSFHQNGVSELLTHGLNAYMPLGPSPQFPMHMIFDALQASPEIDGSDIEPSLEAEFPEDILDAADAAEQLRFANQRIGQTAAG